MLCHSNCTLSIGFDIYLNLNPGDIGVNYLKNFSSTYVMTHESVPTWVVPGGVSPIGAEGSGAELSRLYLSRAKGKGCPTLTLHKKATSSDSGMDLT